MILVMSKQFERTYHLYLVTSKRSLGMSAVTEMMSASFKSRGIERHSAVYSYKLVFRFKQPRFARNLNVCLAAFISASLTDSTTKL